MGRRSVLQASTGVDVSTRGGRPVSRIQLALRVADLGAAVDFYSRLFGTSPAKRRPGYANFAVAEPPLKLVLLEGAPGEPTRMDHLGVEVSSTDEVTAATTRLADAGLATRVEDNTTCCYAVQDKVWVTGPGGEPWEVYTVTGDARADLEGRTELELYTVAGDVSCCTGTVSDTDVHVGAACCCHSPCREQRIEGSVQWVPRGVAGY